MNSLNGNFFSSKVLMILFFQFLLIGVHATSILQPSAKSDQTCTEIKVTFDVIKGVNGNDKNSIKIDLGEVQSSSVIVSLVGPKKIFLVDIQENEISNLSKGTYSLVVVGRHESSNYCPAHVKVVID